MMAPGVQGYKVRALVASLPSFLLCEREYLLTCFIFFADVTDVPTVDPHRKCAAALCTGISPTCDAGSSDPIDPTIIDPDTAFPNAAVECRCVLNLGLSCTVTSKDCIADIVRDSDKCEWYIATFRWEEIMSLETGFNELTKTIFAISMFTSSLDEIFSAKLVAAAYTMCSAWGCLDSAYRCRLFLSLITTGVCYGGLRTLD